MKKENKINKNENIKNFINEFKAFISKGNIVDMAIGVIIGSAFGKIVTSLVNDIFMPIIGIIIGGVDFSNLSITFKNASINYGMFLQNIIDFLIVAFCIFVFVKIINKLNFKKKTLQNKEDAQETKPVKDENIIILEEIRDILKNKKS